MNQESATPLMKQYESLKAGHPDEIVFFRLGDFYEMFGEDAKAAAPVLEITLTQRQGVPMCGIPFHAVNRYLSKLLKRGYRVAIAEQLEDPSTAKGIVKREVVRTISAGTILEENLLNEKSNNFLAALLYRGQTRRVGLAALDISTGEFNSTEMECAEDFSQIASELARIGPSEILVQNEFAQEFSSFSEIPYVILGKPDSANEDFSSFLKQGTTDWTQAPLAKEAGRMIYSYIGKMNPAVLPSLQPLKYRSSSETMPLDRQTIGNLEILKNSEDGTGKNTLLEFLDYTLTPMGARLLKHWVSRPLIHLDKIEERLNTVGFFTEETAFRKNLKDSLSGSSDLERMTMRISSGHLNPRDLIGLKISLNKIESVRKILGSSAVPKKVENLLKKIDPWPELIDSIQNAVADDPPIHIIDGGMIRSGFNADLDAKRKAAEEGKIWLEKLENEEREKTGISTLKIGYTSVFGYYFEVTKSHLSKVPPQWFRKQTLINSERFINQPLKELEEKIIGAEEHALRIEKVLFQELVRSVQLKTKLLQKTAHAIAELDCLISLAEAADLESLVKPKLDYSDQIEIQEGWHPVVKSSLPAGSFVPNDTRLNAIDHQIIILTGPNMSGKSTYLRQTAMIVLMAQIGSFVPAKEARIGVADCIYTRIGSGDRLAKGASTFMVEMQETAKILHNATSRSLVILDEVGRGTSTYDGISIAWAVVEYLANQIKPKVLFATHYFELTQLAQEIECVKNYNVEAKEWQDRVIFLHKIVPGPADRSYGIHVAQLAGLPKEIIDRSKKILNRLEEERHSVLELNDRGQSVQGELDLPSKP